MAFDSKIGPMWWTISFANSVRARTFIYSIGWLKMHDTWAVSPIFIRRNFWLFKINFYLKKYRLFDVHAMVYFPLILHSMKSGFVDVLYINTRDLWQSSSYNAMVMVWLSQFIMLLALFLGAHMILGLSEICSHYWTILENKHCF